jgi:hypothetical protein
VKRSIVKKPNANKTLEKKRLSVARVNATPVPAPTLKMKPEEIALMQQLAKKEQTTSGNKDPSDLWRLIADGYVTEHSATRGDMSAATYKITGKGRGALKAESHLITEDTGSLP